MGSYELLFAVDSPANGGQVRAAMDGENLPNAQANRVTVVWCGDPTPTRRMALKVAENTTAADTLVKLAAGFALQTITVPAGVTGVLLDAAPFAIPFGLPVCFEIDATADADPAHLIRLTASVT